MNIAATVSPEGLNAVYNIVGEAMLRELWTQLKIKPAL